MQCLEMPARQFFSVLGEGRKLKRSQTYDFLIDLCDVAVCANVTEVKYISELKDYFRRNQGIIIAREDEYVAQGPVLKSDSPEAGKILLDLARQKMRLEGRVH